MKKILSFLDENKKIEDTIRTLIAHKMTVATAESCTAGLISAALGSVPGVSEIFCEGYITYSNEAKEKNLGVPHELLSAYGAVSEQVAAKMAEGAAKKANAKVGISATGIAGPGGGTEEKPVGLVYIGIFVEGETTVKKCLFSGDRDEVRQKTVLTAFEELQKRLEILFDK